MMNGFRLLIGKKELEVIMKNPGTAKIDRKTALVTGSYQTINYTFTAGHAIDDTGYVKIVFRFAGDFGTPQFSNPDKADYCSVITNGDCRIEPRWDAKGHTRPWGKALYLKVMGGFLNAGETITLIFGNTLQGSPGWRLQTFCENSFEFKTLVDPFATYQFKEIEKSPTMQITTGEPVKAVCIAPSQVVIGTPFSAFLRIEDRWGNSIGKAREYKQKSLQDTKVQTVHITDNEIGLSAESNPIRVIEKKPDMSQYWADFHGQSEETIGSNSIEDYFLYARDCAKLDIAAHQGNDFQITDEFWDAVNDTTKKYHEPDKFVTFPGYEWSGNTPLGGDRNIYFKHEGGDISRSSHDLLPDEMSKYSPSATAGELFEKLQPEDSFAFAHVGGRYADVSMHKEDVEVAMEIHSAWGTFEWLVQDALKCGYRIGICANSDGHKGRPGASYPGAAKFGSFGGLTCVLASTLDRDHVFEALHARHFFATTGHRPLFNVTVKAGNQTAIMGDAIKIREQEFEVQIEYQGTAAVEYFEIYRGAVVEKCIYPNQSVEKGNRIKVIWSGAERRGRDRQVEWDGELFVSGNHITGLNPINFWNADKQPQLKDQQIVTWKSITTGGLSGIIIELDDTEKGTIEVKTKQAEYAGKVDDIGVNPTVITAGGLEKRLAVSRLPKPGLSRNIAEKVILQEPEGSEDPIFVKIVQEDGHMAWSSPIYIQKPGPEKLF
jgi:uncharacterized protein DUF3604